MLTFSESIELIHRAALTPSGIRASENAPTEQQATGVLAIRQSVSRAEFYGAATAGLAAGVVFLVHTSEYGGEGYVRCQPEGLLRILRTYNRTWHGLAVTELVCEANEATPSGGEFF